MGEWTTAQVQDRLELAAGVMRQMPAVKPQGYFNAWPEYCRDRLATEREAGAVKAVESLRRVESRAPP